MESESDIPFAGLAELVTPLLAHLDEIPAVQATALRGALALGPATPADRFTVPAALLSLLARAADEQPVLAIVDDAQWLDEPSLEAFLFAGRRLGQEGVAMLGAIRDDARRLEVPWLDRLRGRAAARRRGARRCWTRRSRPAWPTGWSPPRPATRSRCWRSRACCRAGQLAGREPLEDPLRPGTGVERAFAVAIEALPDATRRALLVAAAASTRRLDAIGRGLSHAGLVAGRPRARRGGADRRAGRRRARVPPPADALDRLPLGRRCRSAARRTPRSPAPTDSAERAWHLAACAVAPDEAVAAALEAAALDARGRGAHATAARDLGRAAQLTPEAEPRARRLLAAAGDAVRGARGRARARAARRGRRR